MSSKDVKIINSICDEEALSIERAKKLEWKAMDEHEKRVSPFIYAGILLLVFVLFAGVVYSLGIAITFELLPLWVCLIPLGITIGFGLLFYGEFLEYRLMGEPEFKDYDVAYQYWYYTTKYNCLEQYAEVDSISHSVYLILEDKETHEVFKQFFTCFSRVYKTNINEVLYDVKEKKVYLPYKKAEVV